MTHLRTNNINKKIGQVPVELVRSRIPYVGSMCINEEDLLYQFLLVTLLYIIFYIINNTYS